MSRDWHEWYAAYDDPASSLSRRLTEVRAQLTGLLADARGPARLLSLCAGDGRDTLPVLAEASVPVTAVLVELEPDLAEAARTAVGTLGMSDVEVRTADAGTTSCAEGAAPADVVMACGIFGNITDEDLASTLDALPMLVKPGGAVIWTRGCRVPEDPTDHPGDPADLVRERFAAAGFTEVDFVRPDDASYRVGVHRWPGPAMPYRSGVRMFSFV